MRALALMAMIAAGLGGVAAPSASQQARLHVLRDAPLTLHGTGFRAREPVTVSVRMGSTALSRRTRADANGAFTVRFASTRLDACALPVVIRARGRYTGTVQADLGHRDCAMR